MTSEQQSRIDSVENAKTNLLGFYNNMTSRFKTFTVNVPNPLTRTPEGEASQNETKSLPTAVETTTQPVENSEPEMPNLPSEVDLPPGVLCKTNHNITFKVLTEEHLEQVVSLLCNHFFKDEPLGKALSLQSPTEIDHWLTKALPHMVKHDVSIVALDESEDGQGRLVGVAINSVKLKGHPRGPDDFLTWINPQKDPKIHLILSFLHKVADDIDFYKKYNVDKLFVFELLNVDKAYGGKGIASMLVEQSINVAQERGFQCLCAETTGIFSAKIFARNGFKTIKEIPYATQRENGKPIFPSTGIHTCARVSVKILP